MTYKLANKTILGTFWKFMLLFAALSFSYSSPAIAEENASDYDIAAELEALMTSLPSAVKMTKKQSKLKLVRSNTHWTTTYRSPRVS